jgi:hypothetical protein
MNNPPQHPSLLIPLVIICLGISMALFVIGGNTQVTAQQGYPAPNVTASPPSASPPSAYPPPASPTAGRTPIATTAVPPTVPPAPATTTPTMPTVPTMPTTPTGLPTIRPTLTIAPSPTRVPTIAPQFAQVAEATPTVPGALECVPGRLVLISGVAPPHAPLLISFGNRIVGGGSARESGDFALPLIPGIERAGTYEVTIRTRGTGQIVRLVTCTVPPTTPTPVLRRLR